MKASLCRECQAAIFFVTLDGGGVHPVNYLHAGEPEVGVVAVNPAKATGHVVTQEDIDVGRVERWRVAGVELHRSHFSTCPAASAVRNHRPGQEELF